MRRRWIGLVATVALAAIWFVVAIVLHRDFGTTWDDPCHSTVGELGFRYFASWGADRSIDVHDDALFYQPLHEMVPRLFHVARDAALYDVRHLWNALFAITAIPALWLLCRGVASPWLAPFAVVALFAQPRFFGDAFLNSTDVPFAVAVLWFHVALLRWMQTSPLGWREFVLLGLALGFALIERAGGLPLLLGETLVALVVRAWIHRGRSDGAGAAGTAGAARAVGEPIRAGLAVAVAIAWVMMVLPWPSAHRDPLLHPLRAMIAAVHFYHAYPVLHDGELVMSDVLPRWQLPEMLLFTTPLPVSIFAAIGVFAAVRRLARAPRSRRAMLGFVTLLSFAFPVGMEIVFKPNAYDGIRHFLFVLPGLAVLAALGAVTLVRMIARAAPVPVRAFAALAVLSILASPTWSAARLHPYEYIWFNSLIGGVKGAADRFETDYFVTAHSEAIRFVNARAAQAPERRFRVQVVGWGAMWQGVRVHAAANVDVEQVEPADVTGRTLSDGVDFALVTSRCRYATELFPDAPVVHRVAREDVVLCVVRGR